MTKVERRRKGGLEVKMSNFSLKNGLLMMYVHLIKDGGDSQMWVAFLLFCLPGIAGLRFSFYFPVLWIIFTLVLMTLFRCWDDPYKLGWLKK